jgi:NDP-sugar pyrophosphorylase family protein
MRALILAAGFGTRLRPLTERTPKPLLPVVNRPLIEHALKSLHDVGIDDVAVNAHHLAGQIESFFQNGSVFGQRINVVREEPDILGTGGAIKNLRSFLFASNPFLVLNGDTMSAPNLQAAIDAHARSGAVATMILKRDERMSRFGAVEVDDEGRVVDIARLIGAPGLDRGLFIGAHVLSPTLFDHMPPENSFCIIRRVYIPMILEAPGAVRSVFDDAPFFDLGTPDDYNTTQSLLHRDPSLRKTFSHAFTPAPPPVVRDPF